MGVWNNILLILGILVLIEGIIVTLFPDWSMKFVKSISKSAKKLRQIGFIEIIVALILILIGMNI